MVEPLSWAWQRFTDLGVDGLYDLLALRAQVFILEQGPYLDPDGLDRHSWHLLGRDSAGVLRAYLRLVDPGLTYAEPSMGRVVLCKPLRGSGLARPGQPHQRPGPPAAFLRPPWLPAGGRCLPRRRHSPHPDVARCPLIPPC